MTDAPSFPVPTPVAAAVGSRPTEWLSLGPASRLLGVDPDTLRRWADEGRVVHFTTPGGHRRFERRTLERVVHARRSGVRRPLEILGAPPERLTRAKRRSPAADREAAGPTAVAVSATRPQRDMYRRDGRRLVAALLAYIDVSRPADRSRAEADAAVVTDELARRLASTGASLTETVALFVAARRPFLGELGTLATRRALDPVTVAAVHADARGLLDRLLLRLVATHQDVSR